MIRKLIGVALFALSISPAFAQGGSSGAGPVYKVVTTCGTQNYTVGQILPGTMDHTGLICQPSGGGGGGTPGGSSAQVQFNNAGSFGGITGQTSDGTNTTFASGNLKLSGASSGTVTLNAPATLGNTLTLPGGVDTIAGLAAIQTFTNKTISGASNTLTNIGNGSLTNSSITIGSSAVSLGGTITTINGALTFGGANAYGTPASITLTNATGCSITSCVSGLGSGVGTLLTGASSGTGGPAGTASPTFTGTLTAAALTATGTMTTNVTGGGVQCLQASNTGVLSGTGGACGAGGGSATINSGNGITVSTSGGACTTCTISTTVTLRANTATSDTILSTDGGKTYTSSNAASQAISLPTVGTSGFGAGFGFNADAIGAGTATVSSVSNIDGLGSVALTTGQGVSIFSDGSTYHAILGMPQVAAGGFLGNNGGSANYPFALTATQSTAMLNSFTSSLKGLVPASGGGGTNFLRADGAWAVPGGGSGCTTSGSNTQVITDNGAGGCTSNAALTFSSGSLGVGTAGSTLGAITQSGNTSGTITFKPQAAAGTFEWDWPITAGTAGQCLVSQGGAGTAMTWGACSGGGGSNTYTSTFSGNVSGTPGATGLGLVLAAATFTDNATAGSGTAALFADHSVAQPTFAASNTAVTTTHATTFRIAGAPLAGTNETLTATTAFSIAAGNMALESAGQHIDLYNVGSPGATNRELGSIFWNSNVLTIQSAKAGTGVSRDIKIDSSGNLNLNAITGDTVSIQNNGGQTAFFDANSLQGNSSNAVQIYVNTAASGTQPTLVPRRGSSNTSGLGSSGTNILDFILSAVDIMRLGSQHLMFGGTAPTAASNSVSATCTDHCNDNAGRWTVGATPNTDLVVTFNTAWSTAPVCNATDETAASAMPVATVSTTAVTFRKGSSLTASDAVSYRCVGTF